MTIDTAATVAAAQQISEKASQELAQLRSNIPTLETLLTAHEQEQAQIEQQRADDAHTLAHARSQDEYEQQAHREAREYARYAVGLLAEPEATRKALEHEKSAKEAHRLYEETASLVEHKEQERVARLETLQKEGEQARSELRDAHARIDEVQRIESRALTALGASTFARLLEEYQETHQAALEQARETMARAKIEETRFLDQACETLKLWPDLAEKIKPTHLYQDATTDTCQRYIDLIDALIGDNQGSHLAALQQVPSIRNQYLNWRSLFLISSEDLSNLSVQTYYQDRFKPTSLLRLRKTMQTILDEYRASKK